MAELSASSLVHVDEGLVVTDKPAGLLCVPGRGPDKQDCLAARVQALYPDAMVVHRLDMATSGLCVMARGAEAQRRLSMAFAARDVAKCYEAVAQGHLAAPHSDDGWGTIDLPLIPDWPNRPLSKVDRVNGKPSITRWRVLAHDLAAQTTRLALEPVTGRSHQLRLHLQALGHPLLGDALYAPAAVLALAPRLLLHATTLSLTHPLNGQRMSFHSPAPF
ncbi:MAG: RNA pseudouridine synthase [Ramlibacter sp.]|nr:RNA pseudouridine synthase [Ramlibacter sp.]